MSTPCGIVACGDPWGKPLQLMMGQPCALRCEDNAGQGTVAAVTHVQALNTPENDLFMTFAPKVAVLGHANLQQSVDLSSPHDEERRQRPKGQGVEREAIVFVIGGSNYIKLDSKFALANFHTPGPRIRHWPVL
ncbi:hypothetical protein WJX74_009553 [Apatococcus lobatus]|uniref:Uncharacterized protein n=1 Tax=Apatococcus lobatus TaxID=904363 RepID=A0AAW1PUJ6_9CHLO